MATLIDLSHPLEHGQPNFAYDPKISVIAHNTVTSIGYNITQVSSPRTKARIWTRRFTSLTTARR